MIGHLYTDGVVKEDYVDKMRAQIEALPPNAEKIIHHISSPGGNVYAAYKAAPQFMKLGKPIEAQVEGEASSVASFLMALSTTVKATNPSTFMIHEPFFPDGITGALGVDDLDGAKKELDQIRMAMAEAYSKKSGRPVDEWLKIMKAKTRMDVRMAQAYGLVDEVLALEPGKIAALDELKQTLTEMKNELMNLFKSRAVAENKPVSVDLKTKEGKTVMVQSEDGVLVGKTATVDGQPANGAYQLEDGKTLVCVDGKVTEVKEAANPADALKAELDSVKAQLAQFQAAKAEQEAKVKAEQEAQAKQEELKKVQSELDAEKNKVAALAKEKEELEKKTVGNPDKSKTGMEQPYMISQTSPEKKSIMATRSFLADNMPWLERHYKGGVYSDGTTFSSYRTGAPNAVSILETNLNYTWNGILDTDIFFKPTLGTPAIADLATVDLGSSHLKRYHIAPTATKILKPYTGCDQAVTGTSLDITSKSIQIKPFRMKEKWCKDDFTNQLSGSYNELAQQWLKTGNASFDPAGTPVDRITMNLLKDALRRDVFRRFSFGDTTSSNADYNQIDGYWQSLIDQSGASNYCVFRAGSALGTGTLAGGTALTALEAVFTTSDILLKQEGIDGGRAKFYVTRSIWENLYASYAANGAVTEIAMGNLINGIPGQMTFKGIPVIPVNAWDSDLADANNPLSATTRHLISFTTSDNHIVGVENTGDLSAIKSWFSDDDNVRYYSAQMSFGFLGALHCNLTTIAY